MNYFIFRNYTIEPFFRGLNASFSGYEDISVFDKTADCYVWFYLSPLKTNNKIIAKEIEQYTGLFNLTLANIDKNKQFIAFLMSPVYQLNYLSINLDVYDAIYVYNKNICDAAQINKNIKIVDIAAFYSRFSNEQLIDWKYYFLAKIPLNPVLVSDFLQWFSRQIEIIGLNRKKCIVLDLDNTLWGGVLGEDGIEGIKLGEDYPGNVFRFFQSYLLELKHIGIILTICSKNNEADVLALWEKHPDMLLKKNDFVTSRINWNNKADNIQSIAQELNIGLDSMVFIDDNPAEQELVKRLLPQVATPDFPEQPYGYPDFIKKLTDVYFSTYNLTDEDLIKTQQYRENAERDQYKAQFMDIESWLRSLEIHLKIEELNKFNIVRFAQMTQKTNQFNLTTPRYTESDIQAFVDNNSFVYGLRVEDRFGDNGITGLLIIEINRDNAYINTFLLSCRILGKGIEEAFIKYILMKLKKSGIRQVTASYIKTSKNKQVEIFYENIGFEVLNEINSRKDYILILEKADFAIAEIYKLEELCGKE
jgi:FkbH-like protein